MCPAPGPTRSSPESHYRELSPQLAAKLRQMWSARGHDLDRIWGDCVQRLPGFARLPDAPRAPDSRAHDQLCLFDQALIWVIALRTAATQARHLAGLNQSPEQFAALAALTARLVETLAALRLLVLNGLPVPALQLARSVSEDVDMALALLLRPRLAQQFMACTTADEASEFWRRHIAGGRAFRTVAEKLYEVGLDHSDRSEYGRWRREVLTLLGSAVHSSPLGQASGQSVAPWSENAPLRECLGFVTHRLQEFCAWSHVLDTGLEADLVRIASDPAGLGPGEAEARLLQFAARSKEIILDQMRWMLADREEPERLLAAHWH